MNTELLSIRLKSFAFSLFGLALTGISGFLLSADVQKLIGEHFGNTIIGSLAVILVTEIAKHIRNVKLTQKLGARGERIVLI